MIDGKMVLLHAIGFFRRNSDGKVAEFVQSSAARTRQADGSQAAGASGFHSRTPSIAGAYSCHEHVTGSAKREGELSERVGATSLQNALLRAGKLVRGMAGRAP